MDVKLWTTFVSGNDAKHSVPEKYQSGVLHLKYKGLDVFIPGKSIIIKNNVANDTDESIKNANFKSTITQMRCNPFSLKNTARGSGSRAELKKVSAVPVKHSVGVQWSTDNVKGTAEPMIPKHLVKRLIEKFNHIEKRTFSKDMDISENHEQTNSYNNVVKNHFNCTDKTVLVADDGKMFGSGDCGVVNMVKLEEQSSIKRGLVKHLIKLFDAKSTK